MRVGEVITATHNEQSAERVNKCKQVQAECKQVQVKCRQVQAKCKQSASLHTLRKSLIISS